MSMVSADLRPALRGWRVYVLGGVVALVVMGLLASRLHIAGIGGGSSSGSNGSALAGQPGSNAGGGNGQNGNSANGILGNGANGSPSAAPAASGTPSGSGGGPKASPTPKQTVPAATDSINGSADVLQSNCGSGYEPGTTCNVYYHGLYDLASKPAGTLVMEVIIDGVVSGTQSYAAPGGPHRFGGALKFTVPPHAKKIVYQSFLEDVTGKVIVASHEQDTSGYG